MSESESFEGSSISMKCTKFLEFAESLKIPISQDYLKQIRSQLLLADQNSTYVDVGVKNSKRKFNERRLQNALWRSWWRQRQTRCNTVSKTLPPQEEDLGLKLDNMVGYRVWGKDIGDIPTKYNMVGLQEHELPVIGTYVDPNVLPGFRYRVRVCEGKEDEYLFDGKALRLAHVGAGYGKRLTFEDEDILSNENFFWSDSNPDGGYAFSIESLSQGERFVLFDRSNHSLGEALMTKVNTNQKVISCHVDELGATLRVFVQFQCKLFLNEEKSELQSDDVVFVSATVISFKPLKSKTPTFTQITGAEIPGMGHCSLQKCF